MLNVIRKLPLKAPKEALSFLADFCLAAGYDPDGMNEDTAALLAWADKQTTAAQLGALDRARETDGHRFSESFIYRDAWRFPYGAFSAVSGCQLSRQGFGTWLNFCAFNEPAWTWRALKGLRFGTTPIPIEQLLPAPLRGLLTVCISDTKAPPKQS